AFFADGIQDDVLTSLGKIKDLKVIARASVMDYRGGRVAGKIRQIGETLRVSHVLEGSVRRAADHVVVNVALIDTRDERQVWSNRYERTLHDALSLQGELAVDIARELRATLNPAEASVAAAKPTDNAEAYLLYLRARESESADYNAAQHQATMKLYEQAVDLDPKFALARARLSLACSPLLNSVNANTALKTKARTEAEEALRLRPDLGEAHLAVAQYYLWGERDHERALAELARTADLLPNSAEVPLTAAYIYKQQNKWRERVAALRRAESLDPRNERVLGFLALTLRWLREWREALETFDRYAVIERRIPAEFLRWVRANDEFRMSGDIQALKKAIAPREESHAPENPDWLNEMAYQVAGLERDYREAARRLAAVPPQLFNNYSYPAEAHSKPFHEALLAVASKTDVARTKQALEIACQELETHLSSAEQAHDHQALSDLGVLYAFSGRKADAIRAAARAVDVTKGSTIENNEALCALALVYAQSGEQEKAIDLIEQLLTAPSELQRGAIYNMTLIDLKWRWVWDPLRSNPRFQKLLAGPEPKTVY
ncbi:MAG TPA: hypothetical protein VF511_02675, partial [Chthoniobacterales bacterium]